MDNKGIPGVGTSTTYIPSRVGQKEKATSQFKNMSVSAAPGEVIMAAVNSEIPELQQKKLSERVVRRFRVVKFAMRVASLLAGRLDLARDFLERKTYDLANTLLSRKDSRAFDEALELLTSLGRYRHSFDQKLVDKFCNAHAKLIESYKQVNSMEGVTKALGLLQSLAQFDSPENQELYKKCNASAHVWMSEYFAEVDREANERKFAASMESKTAFGSGEPVKSGPLVDLGESDEVGESSSVDGVAPVSVSVPDEVAVVEVSKLAQGIEHLKGEEGGAALIKAEGRIDPKRAVFYGGQSEYSSPLVPAGSVPAKSVGQVSTDQALGLLALRSGDDSASVKSPSVLMTEATLQAEDVDHILFRVSLDEAQMQEKLLAFATVLNSPPEQKVRDWQKVRIVVDEGGVLFDHEDVQKRYGQIISDTNAFLKPLGVEMDKSCFVMAGGPTESIVASNQRYFSELLSSRATGN